MPGGRVVQMLMHGLSIRFVGLRPMVPLVFSPVVGWQATLADTPRAVDRVRTTPSQVRERVAARATTSGERASKIPCVPIVECPSCGVRQYAAASYVETPRCIDCGTPLGNVTVAWKRRSVSGRNGRWRSAATQTNGRFI